MKSHEVLSRICRLVRKSMEAKNNWLVRHDPLGPESRRLCKVFKALSRKDTEWDSGHWKEVLKKGEESPGSHGIIACCLIVKSIDDIEFLTKTDVRSLFKSHEIEYLKETFGEKDCAGRSLNYWGISYGNDPAFYEERSDANATN